MSLAHWFYGSSSSIPEDRASAEIASILAISVPRNGSLGVTGALIFTGNRFAQYIEGCTSAVAELKASILADPRHRHVTTLLEGTGDGRIFPDWSLAYFGRSRFVQEEVERALDDARYLGSTQAERLVKMIREFADRG